MRPFANDAIFVIGMRQGWYKDVGISIEPPPLGRKVLINQAIPLVVNHQLDSVALFPPDVMSSQDTIKSIRFIGLSDLFQGFAILANPSTHAKPVGYFLSKGLSFKQAMVKTMAQLKGQKFATAPVVDNRLFLDTVFKLGGLDMRNDTQLIITPDANALQLTKNGSVKFLSPTGAPFTAQLESAGYIAMVTPLDILKHIPGGPKSPTETLVAVPGIAADAGYASRNPETILRFVSVMFRIIDFEHRDPNRALSYELAYINAFAGTNLTLHGLRINIDQLDPLTDFNFQKNFCDRTSSALYYKTWYNAILQADIKKHALPKGNYPVENLIWACDIYHDLVSDKNQSDSLLRGLKGKRLSASKQALVQRAKRYYAWFDFLDSYRLLKVAAAK